MHSSLRSVIGQLAATVVLVAGCSGSGGGPATGGGGAGAAGATKAPAGPRSVVTARPEPIAWRRTLELGGTLEATERVEIAARVEGAVVSLDADLGDRVERGRTLARITADDFAARVAQSQAELTQARAELSRAEQLVAADLATRQSLEQAQTKVQVAEAQRALAGRQLRDTRVIAPFSGAIADRLVSPGAFVRIGTPLFVLVATTPLQLAIDVPESLAADIGLQTEVTVGAESGAPVVARITRIAPVVDPVTRTIRARVEVPAEEGSPLRPGMYVRARLDLGTIEDAVRVPRPAVFDVLGRSRVVEIVEGRAQPRDVELLAEEEGVAIVRGLPATAEVVTRSPGLIAPGTEVVLEAAPPPGDRELGPPAARAEGEPRSGGT